MNRDKQVDAYLEAAPAGHQALLKKLRAMIRKAVPRSVESFESKMPVYKVDGEWYAAFAWRAKGVMLYITKHEAIEPFAKELGKHRSGKSCVEMKASRTLSAERLEVLAGEMLAVLGGMQ